MAGTAWLVCFISTVNGHSKKKRSLGRLVLVAGKLKTLSKLFLSFDIYGSSPAFSAGTEREEIRLKQKTTSGMLLYQRVRVIDI
jgi:hypothetical protein